MDNNDILQQQVAALNARVATLEREVFVLKSAVGMAAQAQPIAKTQNVYQQGSAPMAQPAMQPMAQPVMQPMAQPAMQPMPQPVMQPMAQPAMQPMPQQTAQQMTRPVCQMEPSPVTQPVCQREPSPVTQPVRKEKNLEKKLGKNIMGIVAAILILVSLILFGGLLLPYITDAVKFVIMYIISLGFAVVGIAFMRKESKYRVLFSAIAAVGISGFYITDLIGRFSFEILNDISLLVLIGVWLVATMFLSKFKSSMFSYVSNAGLIVAAILMGVNWPDIYLGMIIYFVGLMALWGINKSKDFGNDFYIFVQIPWVSLAFSIMYEDMVLSIVLIILNLAIFGMYSAIYRFDRTAHNAMVIICYGVLMLNVMLSVGLLSVDESSNYLVIMPAAGIVSFLIWKFKKESPLRRIMLYVTFYSAVAMYLFTPLACKGAWENIPWYPIAAVVLMALSLVSYEKNYKYTGIAFAFFSLFLSFDVTDNTVQVISALTAGILTIGIIHYIRTKRYTIVDKYLSLTLGILWIIRMCSELETSFVVAFLVIGLLCLYTSTKLFTTNPETGLAEKSSDIINWIFTGVMIVIGDICIAVYHEPVKMLGGEIPGEAATVIILVMLTIALSCINIKRLFNSEIPKSLVGIYTCIKFMFLLIVMLIRFDAVSMVVTMGLLVFAVLCIVFGFRIEIKICRIYGLALTLLCVLKLIIFDITYDSLIMRPVGFFIAGALCFGISWGYSRIEKSHGKSDE